MVNPLLVSQPVTGVCLLRLNRPEKRNALNRALMAALSAAFDAAAADEALRAVVLAGDLRAFCAGADITEMSADNSSGIGSSDPDGLWAAIEHFPKPVVAAVAGAAFGGGLELAMLCDVIIAGDNARFAQPEVKIGAMPGGGGTQRLTRLVGRSLASWMLVTGESIDAATAVRSGLAIERVPADATLPRAIEVATQIAANAPLAVRHTKAAIAAAFDVGLAEGLSQERRLHDEVFRSHDRQEGMLAFLEKRAPVFKGR